LIEDQLKDNLNRAEKQCLLEQIPRVIL
jgi:hypothetical protein